MIPKSRVSEIDPLVAPTGGIDDTSPIANMSDKFALKMVNWFPESGALRVRSGYRRHVVGLPFPAKTLIKFMGLSGFDDRLFACTDDGIYDVTISGQFTKVYTLTEGNCQWAQYSNIAGNWLIVCNGIDNAVIYDGTTWTAFSEVATPAGPGQISGLDPSTIIDVHPHQKRLWFLVRDSMTAYYLPVNEVGGVATAFPMAGGFSRGGYLNSLFTWTIDLGEDTGDILVLQSSEGELAGYSGTDPDTAGAWQLHAKYSVGSPLSRKSTVPHNGDQLLLTNYGLISLSELVGGRHALGEREGTKSGRISRTLNNLVRSRLNSDGWEMADAPSFQYIILSVPEYSGVPSYQFIMNSLTGAWTTFDLPAETFLEYNGMLYFANQNGTVYRHGDSDMDDVGMDGLGGTAVVAGFQQAYSYFKMPNTPKHFKLIRPVFESQMTPQYTLSISTDFSANGGLDDLSTPALKETTDVVWDNATWDIDVWINRSSVHQEWIGLLGMGYSASLSVKTSSTIETRYVASNWAIEAGTSL